ncbi:MAG: hypothetical protein J7K96_00025 [Desulfobacteraceae bacterium]|nr:hypothetical protein [Desulfobacteraceae bacterium]
MFRQFYLMMIFSILFSCMVPVNVLAAADDSHWTPLLDAVFETNNLEMAVLILVNDNNIPVSDIIVKAREMGFGNTRIANALVDSKLSCKQVIIEVLQNKMPPKAIFNSDKICGEEYGHTPESILRLLVKELRFINMEEEDLGKKEKNTKIKQKNLKILLAVCKSMMAGKNYTKYDIMYHLCLADASNETISEAAKRFDVPTATTFKACPRHAEYGHAYISHELPEEAHIIIGVDHLTIDDNSGKGVISPKRP